MRDDGARREIKDDFTGEKPPPFLFAEVDEVDILTDPATVWFVADDGVTRYTASYLGAPPTVGTRCMLARNGDDVVILSSSSIVAVTLAESEFVDDQTSGLIFGAPAGPLDPDIVAECEINWTVPTTGIWIAHAVGNYSMEIAADGEWSTCRLTIVTPSPIDDDYMQSGRHDANYTEAYPDLNLVFPLDGFGKLTAGDVINVKSGAYRSDIPGSGRGAEARLQLFVYRLG